MHSAEAEVSGYLRLGYPDQVDAGTASYRVKHLCSVLCLDSLADIGRPGRGNPWSGAATDARDELDAIRNRARVISEWESALTIEIAQGKYEFQADDDLYDSYRDESRVPSEHGSDVV